ncbi:hypothetical protein C0J52_04134 [Blattella germanica]|nr:hypothetical protein C0J52_04134 [Blattella germanica]
MLTMDTTTHVLFSGWILCIHISVLIASNRLQRDLYSDHCKDSYSGLDSSSNYNREQYARMKY